MDKESSKGNPTPLPSSPPWRKRGTRCAGRKGSSKPLWEEFGGLRGCTCRAYQDFVPFSVATHHQSPNMLPVHFSCVLNLLPTSKATTLWPQWQQLIPLQSPCLEWPFANANLKASFTLPTSSQGFSTARLNGIEERDQRLFSGLGPTHLSNLISL